MDNCGKVLRMIYMRFFLYYNQKKRKGAPIWLRRRAY